MLTLRVLIILQVKLQLIYIQNLTQVAIVFLPSSQQNRFLKIHQWKAKLYKYNTDFF